MSIAGGARRCGGDGGDLGESGIARLPDLHRAVVDELGDGEEGAGGDEDKSGSPRRGQHLARGRGQPHQQPTNPAHPTVE